MKTIHDNTLPHCNRCSVQKCVILYFQNMQYQLPSTSANINTDIVHVVDFCDILSVLLGQNPGLHIIYAIRRQNKSMVVAGSC